MFTLEYSILCIQANFFCSSWGSEFVLTTKLPIVKRFYVFESFYSRVNVFLTSVTLSAELAHSDVLHYVSKVHVQTIILTLYSRRSEAAVICLVIFACFNIFWILTVTHKKNKPGNEGTEVKNETTS